jgi:3-oxoacyl-[acyl-carrier-protein] synthase-3
MSTVRAALRDVAFHLPEDDLSNEVLQQKFPEWTVEKIAAKTGIRHRHIARSDQFASDLAVAAAQKLFANGRVAAADIDFVLLCTQSADYNLPTTACIVQDRLGIAQTAGALDINLGCSGYIYGLGLAKALVETGQARNVLFVTADTYSKFLRNDDKSVRTIFGDAASATWIAATESDTEFIGPFDYGTNGAGAPNLIAAGSGVRGFAKRTAAAPVEDADFLFMNGPAIFNFTLDIVPVTVSRVLQKAKLSATDIDLFVFHQANQFMMEHLRAKLDIPPERFSVRLDFCGNTVSSTIPIALAAEREAGRLRDGMKLMLVGFGVGYSWGSTILRWSA